MILQENSTKFPVKSKNAGFFEPPQEIRFFRSNFLGRFIRHFSGIFRLYLQFLSSVQQLIRQRSLRHIVHIVLIPVIIRIPILRHIHQMNLLRRFSKRHNQKRPALLW